jgi:hypothetical protein
MSERAALELGRRRAAELARRVQTATDAELGAGVLEIRSLEQESTCPCGRRAVVRVDGDALCLAHWSDRVRGRRPTR